MVSLIETEWVVYSSGISTLNYISAKGKQFYFKFYSDLVFTGRFRGTFDSGIVRFKSFGYIGSARE